MDTILLLGIRRDIETSDACPFVEAFALLVNTYVHTALVYVHISVISVSETFLNVLLRMSLLHILFGVGWVHSNTCIYEVGLSRHVTTSIGCFVSLLI